MKFLERNYFFKNPPIEFINDFLLSFEDTLLSKQKFFLYFKKQNKTKQTQALTSHGCRYHHISMLAWIQSLEKHILVFADINYTSADHPVISWFLSA